LSTLSSFSIMRLFIALSLIASVFAQSRDNIVGSWTGKIAYTWINAQTPPSCCPLRNGGTPIGGGVITGVGTDVLLNTVSVTVAPDNMIFATAGPDLPNNNLADCGTNGLNLTVNIADPQDLSADTPFCYEGSVTLTPDTLHFGTVVCRFIFDDCGNFAINLLYCVGVGHGSIPGPLLCPGYPGVASVAPLTGGCTYISSGMGNETLSPAFSQWVDSAAPFTKVGGNTHCPSSSAAAFTGSSSPTGTGTGGAGGGGGVSSSAGGGGGSTNAATEAVPSLFIAAAIALLKFLN